MNDECASPDLPVSPGIYVYSYKYSLSLKQLFLKMNWLYTVCYIIWILFQLIAPMDDKTQDIVPVDPGNYTNSYH